MTCPNCESEKFTGRKKHIAGRITAVIIAVSAAAGIAFGCHRFYTDPYWQLLHSAYKLKNAGSFSFEIKTNQTIKLELPVLSEQSFENETVYKGEVQFDDDESELLVRAESEKDIVLLYVKGDKWKMVRKDNTENSHWTEEKVLPTDIFSNEGAVTAGDFEYGNVLAKNGAKGLDFFSKAFKSYEKLTDCSDLSLDRKKGEEVIEGTVKLSELTNSFGKSDDDKENPFFSAIMILLGGEAGTIDISSMKFTDGELSWNNSGNYPYNVKLDCGMTFDAAEFLSEMMKDSPELQSIVGFLGGFIDADAECDICADAQIYNYGKAHIDTEDIKDIIVLD